MYKSKYILYKISLYSYTYEYIEYITKKDVDSASTFYHIRFIK